MTGLFYLCATILLFASNISADPMEKCVARNVTYKIGDVEQCDKYWECGTTGKLQERLCDDGFLFALEYSHCNYPHIVSCGGRHLLQKSPSTNPRCPRMNGFYEFPAEESCQKFYHCLEGEAYEKTCPEGVIFDPTKGACVHPDLSDRIQCHASKVLNFTCPNSGKSFSKLKFGNHDRLAHPKDCRKFFICTQEGSPRIGGCPLGKVFHPKTGTCVAAKSGPAECKDYYGKKSNNPKLDGEEEEEQENEAEAGESSAHNETSQQGKTKPQNSASKLVQ